MPSGNLKQLAFLRLPRCPHCGTALPNMSQVAAWQTKSCDGTRVRRWIAYACASCGGSVLTGCVEGTDGSITELYPRAISADEALPQRAREFLSQALASISAPSGAVMLAASAVDAMLKEKDYSEGSLHVRINKAASDHAITDDMAAWAHEVRLDANEQRHSDLASPLPTAEDAKRTVEFAVALGEFLFSLPARVRRGRAAIAGSREPRQSA